MYKRQLKDKPGSDGLRSHAREIFLDAVEQADVFSGRDLRDLKRDPNAIYRLGMFRHFYNSSFFEPALKRIALDNLKLVKAELDKLGLPQQAAVTVQNQVTGNNPKRPEILLKKLTKHYAQDPKAPTPDEIDQAQKKVDEVYAKFESLKKLAETPGDVEQAGRAAWEKKRKRAKNQAFWDAIDAAIGDIESGIS